MKRETVYSITELLVILIDHILAYPAAVLFLEFLKVSDMGLTSGGTGLLDGGVSCWILALMLWVILYVIYAAFFFVNKYIRRIDGQGRAKRAINPVMDAVIIIVCLYLSNGIDMVWWPAFIQFILLCGIYVIYLYISHYQEFLMVNDQTIGKSASLSVLKTGLIATVIFAATLMLVLAAVACIPAVREVIDAIVGWIAGLLPRAAEQQPIDNSAMPAPDVMGNRTPAAEGGTQPIWLVIIEILVSAIVTGFIVIGAVAMTQLIFRGIIDYFREKKYNHIELDESIIEDVTDDVEDLKVRSRAGLHDIISQINQTPAQKIRRLYKKYVAANRAFLEKKLGGATVEKSTAREVITAGTVTNDVIEIYEHARYSGDEISADEYKKMKSLMK